MMLLNCPSCGGSASDQTPTCPHCGAPLQYPHGPAKRAAVVSGSRTRFRLLLLAGIGLAVAITLGFVVLVGFVFLRTDDDRTQAALLAAGRGESSMKCQSQETSQEETCRIGASPNEQLGQLDSINRRWVAVNGAEGRSFSARLLRSKTEQSEWLLFFEPQGFGDDALAPEGGLVLLFEEHVAHESRHMARVDRYFHITRGELKGHYLIKTGGSAMTLGNERTLISPDAIRSPRKFWQTEPLLKRGFPK